ncbi:hypothetical protein OSB04_015482 [Centaurea solstitialis]|uniref:Uncharacterized protein n=1 Tax=Centaurea solstitialis TaxID=347529 RepID=A0AA38W7J1_9ASTR|nr:hypothetical protein OSB04_015482 [Centaurea solstitialis]
MKVRDKRCEILIYEKYGWYIKIGQWSENSLSRTVAATDGQRDKKSEVKVKTLKAEKEAINTVITFLEEGLHAVVLKRDKVYYEKIRVMLDVISNILVFLTTTRFGANARQVLGTLQEDYEKRTLQSLDIRQLTIDGCTQNPGDKPLISQEFPTLVPVETDVVPKPKAKQPKEENPLHLRSRRSRKKKTASAPPAVEPEKSEREEAAAEDPRDEKIEENVKIAAKKSVPRENTRESKIDAITMKSIPKPEKDQNPRNQNQISEKAIPKRYAITEKSMPIRAVRVELFPVKLDKQLQEVTMY